MSNPDFVVNFYVPLSHFMPLYITRILHCCFCRREWKTKENSVRYL